MWLKLLSFLTLVIGCIYSCDTFAETIRFINGDYLQVGITSIKNDMLIARSNVLGKLTIPLNTIKTISFTGSYWVRVKGGTEFHLINFKPSGEQFYTQNNQGKGITISNLSSLAELEKKPPPTPAIATPAKERKALVQPPVSKIPDAVKTGAITADDLKKVSTNTWLFSNQVTGYINFDNIGKKNDKTITLSGNGMSQARNTNNRHTINWAFENTSDDGQHTEVHSLSYDYNHFLDPKKFLFMNNSYNYNDTEMPYRLIKASAGFGFQVFDTDNLSLHIEGGPGYTIQSYKQQANLYSPSAFIGLAYNQKITDVISVFNDLNINYTLENGSAIMDGKLGMKYQVTPGFWVEVVHNYIWNTEPEDGYKKYNGNIKFGAGIGW